MMFDDLNHIQWSGFNEGSGDIQLEIGDIEHDISSEISSLLRDRTGSLFFSDRFKCAGHSIDIIYPSIACPGNRGPVNHPDQVRFLLSLYPDMEKIKQVQRIILQPRHIEINGIELVSLYIRREKILVMYLHSPHFYNINSSEIDNYSFLPYYFFPFLSGDSTWMECVDSDKIVNRIPPLWYILSVISHSPDNLIDKFFILNRDERSKIISENLDTISGYYSRNGY